MKTPITEIYLIEDCETRVRCYSEFLKEECSQVVHIGSTEQMIQVLDQSSIPRLVLLDLEIENGKGAQVLQYILHQSPDSVVVAINGDGSYETSRVIINCGAFDYLEKPFTRDRLCVTMRNATKQFLSLGGSKEVDDRFCGFIGTSEIMKGVYSIIESAAQSNKASVFITGESGTGKEVCSQAIHTLSDRRENECVILNCAAIPKDLIESEIFGHVKGAFTGATSVREGAARRAHKGTLFLDEIGEMDLELQSKLLRFIQTGEFCKVGSNEVEKVDVRFICATNRDPLEEVRLGNFREDLYYRLNVIPIHMPALRERGEDIIQIAEYYLKEFAAEEGKIFQALSYEVQAMFSDYLWPGNVRQLLNVIRNIVVLHSGEIVHPEMLPSPFNGHAISAVKKIEAIRDASREIDTPIISETVEPLWKMEMEYIDRVIRLCEGNVTHAAKLLEISASTIHRKRQQWTKKPIRLVSGL